jgi:hypothetical protein
VTPVEQRKLAGSVAGTELTGVKYQLSSDLVQVNGRATWFCRHGDGLSESGGMWFD